MIRVKS
jgi:hypothetical protein